MPKNYFTRKNKDFDTFTPLPKNVGDLGKLIVAKGSDKLPKVQQIAQSGHTVPLLFFNLKQSKSIQLSTFYKIVYSAFCSNNTSRLTIQTPLTYLGKIPQI